MKAISALPASASWRPVAVGMVLEAGMWLVPAALFLAVFVARYDMPATAIPAHLAVVFMFAGALALPRIVVRILLPQAKARWVDLGLLALGLAAQWAYYGLVLIGMASWRRVPTLELLEVYVRQFGRVIEVLGVAPALVGAPILAVFALLCVALWFARVPMDWIAGLVRIASPISRWGMVGLMVISVTGVFRYWLDGELAPYSEPLSLTVHEEFRNHADLQSHTVRGDPVADAREQAARVAYVLATSARRSNVILIVADALRADHMSLNGYARPTTPNLARLASEVPTRRVEAARAVCSESPCGLLGLASGRYVHQFVRAPMTLQEVLRLHGYRVSLILGGDHTGFYGLRRMYGRVDDYVDGPRLAGYVNDDHGVIGHVAAMPPWDGQPRMLQFHLMSTHCLGSRAAEHVRYRPVENYCASFGGRLRDQAQREGAVNHYDNGVHQLDEVVTRLIGQLKDKGYLKDALVVLVGDHGEYLGEFGRIMHAHGVHEPVIGIPLLIFSFGEAAQRPFARRVASQADLAPTILADLGMPRPATWTGVPLQENVPVRFLYFQQAREFGLIDTAAADGPWKYWRDLGAGREFAYRIARDPQERENLIASVAPDLLRRWRGEVDTLVARAGPTRLLPIFEDRPQ
ncbi:MAG: sulfatase-like hydrolase/transferase [Burkholderiales bacterium]